MQVRGLCLRNPERMLARDDGFFFSFGLLPEPVFHTQGHGLRAHTLVEDKGQGASSS
ncbi:hypothetical protein MASR1M90_06410 [Desulfovibrionales bacterium]